MSKQQATNTWSGGLNKDLYPMVTPNTMLTDNLNGTLITYNGNEFSLQNDMGNVKEGHLSPNFYPIGMTEYGGILYIVSINSESFIQSYTIVIEPEDCEHDKSYFMGTVNAIVDAWNESVPDIQITTDNVFQMMTCFGNGWVFKSNDFDVTSFINDGMDAINDVISTETGWSCYYTSNFGCGFEIGSFPSLDPTNHTIDSESDPIDFEYVYRPLHNLLKSEYPDQLFEFSTDKLPNYNKEHPVNIEVQPSYDGSVNLILNDNNNPPRLINSEFATLGNGKGKFIKRHQGVRTNCYNEESLDAQTKLIQNSTKFTYIDLGDGEEGVVDGIQMGGQLKGGNYTFYLRYGDDDQNKTDIICESGIISVFNGTPKDPFSMNGAFMNEITDKSIYLTIKELDTNFAKIYLSYTREYCDQNGYRLVEAKELSEPYTIEDTSKSILITGLEIAKDISIEELNVKYHTVSRAKTIAQQQNMLFLGNTGIEVPDNEDLQNLSYKIKVSLNQDDSVGFISPETYLPSIYLGWIISAKIDEEDKTAEAVIRTKTDIQQQHPSFSSSDWDAIFGEVGFITNDDGLVQDLYPALLELEEEGLINHLIKGNASQQSDSVGSEYYDPKNIYYKVGYWPDEYYRLGIVYIKSDGTKTDVFDLLGYTFEDTGDNDPENFDMSLVPTDEIGYDNWNIKGVFKTPELNVIEESSIKPIYFSVSVKSVEERLNALGIIGYFIVRQKRIPITIAQGLSIGINNNSFIPMICTANDGSEFYTESFITANIEDDVEEGGEIKDYNRLLLYDKQNIRTGAYMCKLQLASTNSSWSPFENNGRPVYLLGIFDVLGEDETAFLCDDPENPGWSINVGDAGKSDVCKYLLAYWGTVSDRKNYPDAYIEAVEKKAIEICKDYAVNHNIELISEVPFAGKKEARLFPYTAWDLAFKHKINQWEEEKTYYNKSGNIIAGIYRSKDGMSDSTPYRYACPTPGHHPCYCNPDPWSDTCTSWRMYNPIVRINQLQFTTQDKWYEPREVPGDYAQLLNYFNYNNRNLTDHNIYYQNIKDLNLTKDRYTTDYQKYGYGILSKEVTVTPEYQSLLKGQDIILKNNGLVSFNNLNHMFSQVGYDMNEEATSGVSVNAIYINNNTAIKYINKQDFSVGFSTMIGDASTVKKFGYLKTRPTIVSNDKTRDDLVRGLYTDFVGVYSPTIAIPMNGLYTMRVNYNQSVNNIIKVRGTNQDAFYAITDLHLLSQDTDVYRGDCYSNTVTIRMVRNFIDATNPVADQIVDVRSWREHFKGLYNSNTEWNDINLTDVNTVDLGHWITFKCLASINLALRSEDTSNVSEYSLLGNPRSFYPVTNASVLTPYKVADTTLFNQGYGATVDRIRHLEREKTPYDKNEFSTRVIFSNVSVSDSFQNGYRIFQGLSYQDFSTQYGAIIKLLPWGNNLFCVFEHGITIIPINEKALLQTTTEDTIHIYGHGVLPEQMSVISPDYGSVWADSVIKTPLGVYGVDTSSKKIWQYTDAKGLITISDMKIQRFLNDEMNIGLKTKEYLGVTNVKTHYNEYKGDVIFTFYNDNGNNDKKEWSLCYNERQGLWVTRYDWYPLLSANADNTFYTLNLKGPDAKSDDSSEDDCFGIWKHGRTGIDKLILPTNWYGNQHKFEFEFAVNEPTGITKIFENLAISSNNVQPESFEFQIIGDDYLFNRARIYHELEEQGKLDVYGESAEDIAYAPQLGYPTEQFTKQEYQGSPKNESWSPLFYNARLTYDRVLDEYELVVSQPCRNKEVYGIRRGNIQYRDNAWHTDIEPLRYNPKLKNPNTIIANLDDEDPNKFVSAKLRDKWMKVKIKYKGDRLAIIGAVTTTENISYV